MKIVIPLLMAFAACSPATSSQENRTFHEQALELHRQTPLIDGHNDLAWQYWQQANRDISKMDLNQAQMSLHTDIPRLKQGAVGGQFWSAYVPVSLSGTRAVRETLEQIDIIHQIVDRYPEVFEFAATANDVERIFRSGKIASLIGVEGGHSIGGSMDVLRNFYRLGVRYMTLTHSANVEWADSATDRPRHGGLTTFGEAVVREMNRMGMLVDLSHVSDQTMRHALRITQAPVIFSHSSARAVTDHPRNVPDDVLEMLPVNGGIIMTTFVPAYVSAEVKAYEEGRDAERRRMTAPQATLEQVANHIDHIRRIAGIDHVGLGSDFDGIPTVPRGLEDVAQYPSLTAELLRRGYSQDDLRKILGLNILRVMRQAEATAQRLKADGSASAENAK